MEFDTSFFKRPQVWMVIIPAVLTVWAIGATVGMVNRRKLARIQHTQTEAVWDQVREIKGLLKRAGRDGLAGESLSLEFDRITSARQCARAAVISEEKLQRVESPSPRVQKDGSLLYQETYKLNGVRLLQIASFIDHAERHYTSLHCTQATVYPARIKKKDSWDATINLQYLKKKDVK